MSGVLIGMIFNCDEIISGRLWVGSFFRPEDAAALKRIGISAVVDLQSDSDMSEYGIRIQRLQKALLAQNIELIRIPIEDFIKEEVALHLSECVYAIESALNPLNARVYLHCTAGVNRAPTAAAAYLVKSQGLSAQEAYDHLVEKRNCRPYLDILEEYARSLNPRS